MPDPRWLCLYLVLLAAPAFAAAPPGPPFVEPPFRLLRILPQPKDGPSPMRLAWSPDGQLVATAGGDLLSVWKVEGRLVGTKRFAPEGRAGGAGLAQAYVRAIVFVKGGQEIAVLRERGANISLLDSRTLKTRAELPVTIPAGNRTALVISPDGNQLVVYAAKQLVAWDLRAGRRAWAVGADEGPFPHPLHFGRGGKTLVGALGGVAPFQIRDASTGVLVRNFAPRHGKGGRHCSVRSSDWCPAAGLFAGGVLGQPLIFLWDEAGEPAGEIRWRGRKPNVPWPDAARNLPHCTAYELAFSRDGKTIAAACSDRFVRLFEVAGGGIRAEWEPSTETVAFSPDGRFLATLGESPADVRLYD